MVFHLASEPIHPVDDDNANPSPLRLGGTVVDHRLKLRFVGGFRLFSLLPANVIDIEAVALAVIDAATLLSIEGVVLDLLNSAYA